MVATGVDHMVRRRAGTRCEYCRLPELAGTLRHAIDHVIARQHHGSDDPSNLALCCIRCNLAKGPNIAGLDPVGLALTRLFNPRSDAWSKHFRYEGPVLIGLTPEGRTTADLLGVNAPVRLRARAALLVAGITFS
jgi:hypothetical protein